MKQHTYLIVGGGMTTASALNGIRQVDAEGDIAVISAENQQPYDRPPLSKQLWTGKKRLKDIWRKLPDGVTFHLGRRAIELNLERKEIRDDAGTVYRFKKLLLATGGTPRRLPFGDDHIIYYRTLDNYRRLQTVAQEQDRFAVIGGGFIGSEIAAALAMQGKQVTVLFPEPAIGARIFPGELAGFLNDYYRQKGVQVLSGETAVGLESEGTNLTLHTESGRHLQINGVIAGIGITPNVGLAEAAGLDVADGVIVDGSLRTSHPDIYAAGDVAAFYDEVLHRRRRVEHEDAANTMGEAAGRAMAGADVVYRHTPAFYSDMFDLGYEAVGLLDARLETVERWEQRYRKGIIYYLEHDRVRGVLLWNVWGKVNEARQLLGEQTTFSRQAQPLVEV